MSAMEAPKLDRSHLHIHLVPLRLTTGRLAARTLARSLLPAHLLLCPGPAASNVTLSLPMLQRIQNAVARSGFPAAAAATGAASQWAGVASSACAAAESARDECLYAVLGVAHTASAEELKAAFRKVGCITGGRGSASVCAPACLERSSPAHPACCSTPAQIAWRWSGARG